jgi:hypothetical protein
MRVQAKDIKVGDMFLFTPSDGGNKFLSETISKIEILFAEHDEKTMLRFYLGQYAYCESHPDKYMDIAQKNLSALL